MPALFQGFAPRANGGPAVQRPRRGVLAHLVEAAVKAITRLDMRPRKLMIGQQFRARVGEFCHRILADGTELIICQSVPAVNRKMVRTQQRFERTDQEAGEISYELRPLAAGA